MSRLSLDASRRVRPTPFATDISRPYWNAAREGVLRLQRCRNCQTAIHYPRRWCPKCWSTDLDHFDARGTGVVITYTIVHQSPFEAFDAYTPYVLAIVQLDEGPTMLTNIIGPGAMEVTIGDPVLVRFEKRNGWTVVPQFERVRKKGRGTAPSSSK
jgi:uncharacterized OB-fold protein